MVNLEIKSVELPHFMNDEECSNKYMVSLEKTKYKCVFRMGTQVTTNKHETVVDADGVRFSQLSSRTTEQTLYERSNMPAFFDAKFSS